MKIHRLAIFAGLGMLSLYSHNRHYPLPRTENREPRTENQEPRTENQELPSLLPDSLPLPCIRLEADTIGNANTLDSFFTKLTHLAGGQRRQVRIVHIGDSHIQADYFTGALRALFQQRFGNAGRGFVFPYTLAGTHAPVDLSFRSNCRWEGRRSVYQKIGPPIGIAGISIESSISRPTIQLTLKDRYEDLDYAFDQITVFQEKGERFISLAPLGINPFPGTEEDLHTRRKPVVHVVKTGDTLYNLARKNGCTVTDLQQWNELADNHLIKVGQQLIIGYEPESPPPKEPVITHSAELPVRDGEGEAFDRYLLPAPARELALVPSDNRSGTARIYGVLLENSRTAGVLYNMIGVNGTTYYHFNRAERFWQQLPFLEPDLVIVSLGTNEALASNFDAATFRAEVSRFLGSLHQALGDVPVLLTTNPDVLRRRRYANPNNEKVKEILLDEARRNETAWWDLYEVMGGAGSVRSWREKELAHTDFIHFTKEGYILQAQLFFEALSNAYAAHY